MAARSVAERARGLRSSSASPGRIALLTSTKVGAKDGALAGTWRKQDASAFERATAPFAKVDTEAEQGLAAALQIQSIPTIMIFRDGILLFNQAGAMPEHSLEEIITTAEGLNMEEIRAEIEMLEKGNQG